MQFAFVKAVHSTYIICTRFIKRVAKYSNKGGVILSNRGRDIF